MDVVQNHLIMMAKHFGLIIENVNEVELYNHSVKMNEDLFQTYFGMSMSLAKELQYIEE